MATPVEEGYSSSETLRPERRQVLYSPGLQRRHETRNTAIQTRKPWVQNRATQTEAEALPLLTPAPIRVQRIIHLALFLGTAGLLLAFAASLPGAHARPLTAAENFPCSAAHLFRSFATISSIMIIAKKVIHLAAAAPYPEIPALPPAPPAPAPPALPAPPAPLAPSAPPAPSTPPACAAPPAPPAPLTWRDRRGERRSCERGESRHYQMRRVQVLQEGKAEVLALSSSGHACNRPLR